MPTKAAEGEPLGLIFGDVDASVDATRVREVITHTKAATPSWFSLLRRMLSAKTRGAVGLTSGL
jgi:hypothetical protein